MGLAIVPTHSAQTAAIAAPSSQHGVAARVRWELPLAHAVIVHTPSVESSAVTAADGASSTVGVASAGSVPVNIEDSVSMQVAATTLELSRFHGRLVSVVDRLRFFSFQPLSGAGEWSSVCAAGAPQAAWFLS